MFHRFLQSVFICDMFFCCDANIRTGYQNLQYGYRLDGEMIDSFAEHSILDCVKECLRTTRCLSLSYYGGANYCEINYENKRTASGRYIKSLGWVYSQREDWPMELLGICSTSNCNIGEKCEEVSSTRFQCKIADCGLPEIRGVDIESVGRWNGIGTGQQVRVQCEEGYTTIGSGLLHCQSNGQWKMNIICGCLPQNVFGEHCYMLHSEVLLWEDAKAQCEKEGGYLAEVGTAAENQWLFQTFVAATFSEEDCPKYYSCAIWIGGNDLKQEGHFVWSHNNNTIPLTNGLWLTGRPNDFKKEQDCLAITHSSGLWNDLSCSTERPFICEFEF